MFKSLIENLVFVTIDAMNGAQFIALSLGSCLLVFILQVKAEGQFNSICAMYLLVEVELRMELIMLFGGSMYCSLCNNHYKVFLHVRLKCNFKTALRQSRF